MQKELFNLFRDICPDFEEYSFLKTDLYKGQIRGGYNLYYKKGADNKEGMVTGKKNIKRFELDQFPKNFITYGKFDLSDAEYGWCDEELIKVLRHIKSVIEKQQN